MSLIKVADVTKKILLVVTAIIVLLLLAKIIVSISERLTETLITHESLETRGFGNLPPLTMKQIKGAEEHSPEIELETLTGELPKISNLFNVYRIRQPELTLSSEAQARDLADSLEFVTQPKELSSVDWIWEELNKSLEVDIQTQHFTYKNSSPTIPENAEPNQNPERVLEKLLSSLNYAVPEDAEFDVEYLVKRGDEYITTNDESAPWIRVSMYYSLVYSGENEGRAASTYYLPGNTHAVFPNVNGVSLENSAEISYYYWEVEPDTMQTYEGISVDEAYTQVSEGQGALVYGVYPEKAQTIDPAGIQKVWITDVKAGYYTSKANLLYLQPIYIFYGTAGEGENRIELVYFVPAL